MKPQDLASKPTRDLTKEEASELVNRAKTWPLLGENINKIVALIATDSSMSFERAYRIAVFFRFPEGH